MFRPNMQVNKVSFLCKGVSVYQPSDTYFCSDSWNVALTASKMVDSENLVETLGNSLTIIFFGS